MFGKAGAVTEQILHSGERGRKRRGGERKLRKKDEKLEEDEEEKEGEERQEPGEGA